MDKIAAAKIDADVIDDVIVIALAVEADDIAALEFASGNKSRLSVVSDFLHAGRNAEVKRVKHCSYKGRIFEGCGIVGAGRIFASEAGLCRVDDILNILASAHAGGDIGLAALYATGHFRGGAGGEVLQMQVLQNPLGLS